MNSTPLRIALLGTPRSGNTWLRYLLGAAAGMPSLSFHGLDAGILAGLPRDCVMAVHLDRDPANVRLLESHGFRVLTIARHPFDTLVSILQFAIHDSESERWLQGQGGDESGLFGAMPGCRAFVEYAVGDRAKTLLNISAAWWGHPGAVAVRYEDLVRDPAGELVRLLAEFCPGRTVDLKEIVDHLALEQLRKSSINNHFWKGEPGLWRQFLAAPVAREIAVAHGELFRALGYACDPDEALTDSRADRNWIAANGPSLRAALRRSSASHLAERAAWKAECERLAGELRASEQRTAEARARFVPFEGLQGLSVKVARSVQTVRDRVRPNQPR